MTASLLIDAKETSDDDCCIKLAQQIKQSRVDND